MAKNQCLKMWITYFRGLKNVENFRHKNYTIPLQKPFDVDFRIFSSKNDLILC